MSDIFREIEEDVRREHYRKLWDKYGIYFVAIAFVAIVGVAATILYRTYMHRQAETASAAFEVANALVDAREFDRAVDAFRAIADDAPDGYATLARFRLGAALGDAGRPAEAVAIFDALATTLDDPNLRGMAAIKLAWMLADIEPPDRIRARVEPYMGADNAWRYPVMELLAYQDFRAGKLVEAKAQFEALAADTTAPRGTADRAEQMAAVINTVMVAPDATIPPIPAPPQPDLEPALPLELVPTPIPAPNP